MSFFFFFFLGEGAQLIKHGTNEKVNRDDTAREKERGRLGRVCMTNVEVHDRKRGLKVEAQSDIVLLWKYLINIQKYRAHRRMDPLNTPTMPKCLFQNMRTLPQTQANPYSSGLSHILPSSAVSHQCKPTRVYMIQKARVQRKAVLSSIQRLNRMM